MKRVIGSCNSRRGKHWRNSEQTVQSPLYSTTSFLKMKNSVYPDTNHYTYWSEGSHCSDPVTPQQSCGEVPLEEKHLVSITLLAMSGSSPRSRPFSHCKAFKQLPWVQPQDTEVIICDLCGNLSQNHPTQPLWFSWPTEVPNNDTWLFLL